MSTARKQVAPVHVKDEGDVVLHPEDDDLFVQTGKQVIQACRLGIGLELWLSELKGMLAAVREWTTNRAAGKVRSCYCAPRGAQTALFFIPSTDHFDFDLADELAKFNGELVKNFNVGMIEIHQIPAGELDRFIDPDSARLVYGEDRRPHPAVEA